jgi:hypothetical protein
MPQLCMCVAWLMVGEALCGAGVAEEVCKRQVVGMAVQLAA